MKTTRILTMIIFSLLVGWVLCGIFAVHTKIEPMYGLLGGTLLGFIVSWIVESQHD